MKNIFVKIYKDSLLKNSAYFMVTNFFSLIIGFFFWVVVARYYKPDDVGIASAMLSNIYLISTIGSIGLPVALTFYLPIHTKDANKIINSCMIISIVVTMIFSFISIIGIRIWVPEMNLAIKDLWSVIIFIMVTIMTTMSSLMTGIFTAGKRSSFHMIKENIFSITKIFFIILFSSFGAIGILLSWNIGLMISTIVGFFLMHKLWRYTPMIVLDPIINDMANFSIGNYIASIFYFLPRYIFPILIVNLISAESAGYFFISMTIAGLLYGIPTSTVGPFLVESSDKKKFWNNVNKVIKFNTVLLIPGLFICLIFGKFILNIFNPSYADHSFTTLAILSLTSIPMSLIVIFNTVRSAQKRVTTVIKINGTVAAIAIILSVPLMRIWNIEGAAVAYLVANTIVATFIMFKMKNTVDVTLKMLSNDKDVFVD